MPLAADGAGCLALAPLTGAGADSVAAGAEAFMPWLVMIAFTGGGETFATGGGDAVAVVVSGDATG